MREAKHTPGPLIFDRARRVILKDGKQIAIVNRVGDGELWARAPEMLDYIEDLRLALSDYMLISPGDDRQNYRCIGCGESGSGSLSMVHAKDCILHWEV